MNFSLVVAELSRLGPGVFITIVKSTLAFFIKQFGLGQNGGEDDWVR